MTDVRRTRLMNRRMVVQRRIRRMVMVILMILAFCFGFLGHTLIAARAEEQTPSPQLNRYYTSIQLQHGDSLWSIAGQYMDHTGYTQDEYVRELVRMNGLMTDQIHSGEYLAVMYMAE